MSYFAFLAVFLGIPLVVFSALTWWDMRRGVTLPAALQSRPAWMAIVGHVIVAVVYTTPWDNYLVATSVWWYNPALVTGITLGYVPIEEYTFFVLQTVLTSLILLWVARRVPVDTAPLGARLRGYAVVCVGIVWLASVVILISGWQAGIYLALILVWALPPIGFQLGFGADILWRYRVPVLSVLAGVTLYLALADSVAIGGGTWTIDPEQSVNVFLGVLPIEEFIFFLLTNTLVVFGTTLVLARESQERASRALRTLRTVKAQEQGVIK